MSLTQPSRTAVCTIVSKNYLAHARTLMGSVREAHPRWERYVLLVDEPDGLFDPARERSRIVRLEELDLPDRQKFLYRYTLLEANTAVKPWLLGWLFRAAGADQVIYLDPDVYVYQPLADVTDLLGRGALMVLTPHLTGELNDGKRPGERDILQAGCYNLGFLALARHPDLSRFLAWWRRKLELDCRVDLAGGLFVDQRWMDLAPGLFADVAVLRHPGYNVAYWNLNHRPVRLVDGLPHVGDVPLVFFHFSGFNPARPRDLSKHQDRFRRLRGAAGALLDRYRRAMRNNGWETCREWPYAYGALQDGTRICDSMRRYYRTHPLVQQRVGPGPFAHPHDYLNEPWGGTPGPLVTRLMRQVWEERTDLQEAFPDIDGAWREDFVHHFLAEVAAQAGLADRFIEPAREALRAWQNRPRPEGPAPGPPALALYEPPSFEGEPIHPLARIIRFAARWAIALLPLPMTTDRARRIARLLRPLGRLLPEAVRRQLRSDLPFWLNRRRAVRRALLASLRDALARPLRKALELLRLVQPRPLPPEAPPEATPAPETAPAEERILKIADHRPAPAGVNIIGYVRAETGVGESVRLCARAATAAGLPFALLEADAGDCVRACDERWTDRLAERTRYPISLFHVNPDVMSAAHGLLARDRLASRYVIGYWHWELPEFPDRWLGAFDRVDEVWVPTRFIQDAVSARSPRPVVRIPHGISFRTDPGVTRADLGLPAGRFLFLTMYDAESYQARKNPEGTVEAFRRAFAASGEVSLVVKVNNPNNHPGVARLKALAKRLPNLVILDRVLPRRQVYELLRLCDCFVSLHRSEGFGLGLAEAMFLGKPVIATGWSGNMDFMTRENSCPVRYRLVPLEEDVGPYDRGRLWADPDREHAAYFMKKVVAEPGWGEEVGASGRETIRSEYAPERVGRLYVQRLGEILRQGLVGRKTWRAAA
jgi:glycosyltransferase involved in cell wall biosynthesis